MQLCACRNGLIDHKQKWAMDLNIHGKDMTEKKVIEGETGSSPCCVPASFGAQVIDHWRCYREDDNAREEAVTERRDETRLRRGAA